VRKTLLAARAMDYPHKTWLLDDGRRPEMEALRASSAASTWRGPTTSTRKPAT
jgi:hypothetical protein